jgi:hypothetical protein
MDINLIFARFAQHARYFIDKVRAHIPDIPANFGSQIAEIEKAIVAPSADNARALMRFGEASREVEEIMREMSRIDLATIFVRMDVSSTTRGIIAQLQRKSLDDGSDLLTAINEQISRMMTRSDELFTVEQVAQMLRESIATHHITPIIARLSRKYVPLMAKETRFEMRVGIAQLADELLGVTRVAIDENRDIIEQITMYGSLVPLTVSMNRNALFEIFGSHYEMAQSFEDNFAQLASVLRAHVIFVLKKPAQTSPTQTVIEFDDRPLFDSEFINRAKLSTAPFLGLCDRVIARFNTLRELTLSGARAPHFHVARYTGGSAISSLVTESLTGNMFRIMGVRRSDGESKNPRDKYLTDNIQCQFLLFGPSNRADNYHRIAGEAIIRASLSESARSIIGMQTGTEDTQVADAMKSRAEILISRMIRDNFAPSVAEILDMLIDDTEWTRDSRNAISRARIMLRARDIARNLDAAVRKFAPDVAKIIERLGISEMCEVANTSYMIFERAQSRAHI